MTRPPAGKGPLASLLRFARNLVLALAASLLAMAFSYHLVRYILAGHRPGDTPKTAVIQQADELRMYSNELLRLTAELLRRAAADRPGAFETWLERDMRPRLNGLRRQMHDSSLRNPAFSQILGAADRVAAMARNPGQANLRRLATSEVLDANLAVEDYIASLGVGRFLSVSAGAPRFSASP